MTWKQHKRVFWVSKFKKTSGILDEQVKSKTYGQNHHQAFITKYGVQHKANTTTERVLKNLIFFCLQLATNPNATRKEQLVALEKNTRAERLGAWPLCQRSLQERQFVLYFCLFDTCTPQQSSPMTMVILKVLARALSILPTPDLLTFELRKGKSSFISSGIQTSEWNFVLQNIFGNKKKIYSLCLLTFLCVQSAWVVSFCSELHIS